MRTSLILAVMLGASTNQFGPDVSDPICTREANTADDIIRDELKRRAGFDKQCRSALTRLLVQPDPEEIDRLT